MNTTQLTTFLTLTETLNFAKTAEQLNITQPAVTQQIRALEEELNAKLFSRNTRRVELTRAGLFFINDARSILGIADRAKKRAEDSFEDHRRLFAIGCHAHGEIHPLAGVLQTLRQQFPNLYPAFQVIPFRLLYQHLVEGSVDVIVSLAEGGLKNYIQYQELAKVPALAVMQAAHPLARQETVRLCDLETEKLVLIEPRRCPEALQAVQHQAAQDRSVLDIYLADSMEATIALAQAGFGIAIVPAGFFARNPALAYLPVRDAKPMSYGMYYPKQSGNPMLKAFLRIAKEQFSLG